VCVCVCVRVRVLMCLRECVLCTHEWNVALSAMDPDRMVVEAAAKAQFQNQYCVCVYM